MTLDELLAREAIRATIAAYTMAGDRLHEADFVRVFTDDAILETEHVAPADAFRYEGREAIRRWITRWRDRPADGERPHRASFVRHHLATCQIELTGPDAARGRIYWTALTDIGPDHAGHYLDRYARVDDAWLIAHRRIREDWRSPESLFTSAVANTR